MLGQTVSYSVRLQLTLRDQLEQAARASGRKPSDFVRMAIKQAVERQVAPARLAGEVRDGQ